MMQYRILRHTTVIIAILLLHCWQRAAWLREPNLNIDESQYQAIASFLVTTGQSTFTDLYFHMYHIHLYRLMAEWFGDYNIFSVRIVFLVIACFHASLVYYLASHVMPMLWAVGATLLSVVLAWWYEGLSANCEWPSSTAIVLALSLYVTSLQSSVSKPASCWLVVLAGFVAAWGFWLKSQASFLLLVIPVGIFFEMINDRKYRQKGIALACYVIGGFVGTGAATLPIGLYGNWDKLREQFNSFFFDYMVANTASSLDQTSKTLWGLFWIFADSFFLCRPGGTLHLLAFMTSIFVLARMSPLVRHHSESGSDSNQRHVEELILGLYVIAAMLCVQLGWRWSSHYFLFADPAFAIAAVWAIRRCFLNLNQRERLHWCIISLAPITTIAIEVARSFQLPELREKLLIVILVVMAFGLSSLWWAMLVRRKLSDHWSLFLPSLIMIIGTIIFLSIDPLLRSPSFVRPSQATLDIASYLRGSSAPTDRLFVWGWRPEIYTSSELPCASRTANCAHIVGDFARGAKRNISMRPGLRLLEDLKLTEPRWIVDASSISFSLSQTPDIYSISGFTALEELLESKYSVRASVSGCTVYMRNE